jgi:hypothetical protein
VYLNNTEKLLWLAGGFKVGLYTEVPQNSTFASINGWLGKLMCRMSINTIVDREGLHSGVREGGC